LFPPTITIPVVLFALPASQYLVNGGLRVALKGGVQDYGTVCVGRNGKSWVGLRVGEKYSIPPRKLQVSLA